MFKKIILSSLVLGTLAVPLAASASVSFPYWGPLVICSGSNAGDPGAAPTEGTTPLKQCTSFCNVVEEAQALLYFGMTLAAFALLPAMALWGAFQVIVGGANPESVKKGRKTIFNAIIGAGIALSAFLIISTFLWLIGNNNASAGPPVQGVSWPNVQCSK